MTQGRATTRDFRRDETKAKQWSPRTWRMAAPRFRARRVVLDDGTPLTIRAIRPGDRQALRAAFRRLSPESRYQRFHGHFGDLSEPMLRYLTEIDGVEHFAVVAVLDRTHSPLNAIPLPFFERWRASPEIVGVARMIRLKRDAAEVAITIADAFQGRGVGSRLMKVLVQQAARIHVDRLIAHVSPTNRAMRRLLEKSGVVSSTDDAVTTTLPERSRGKRGWKALRYGRVNFVLAVRWVRSQRGTA